MHVRVIRQRIDPEKAKPFEVRFTYERPEDETYSLLSFLVALRWHPPFILCHASGDDAVLEKYRKLADQLEVEWLDKDPKDPKPLPEPDRTQPDLSYSEALRLLGP